MCKVSEARGRSTLRFSQQLARRRNGETWTSSGAVPVDRWVEVNAHSTLIKASGSRGQGGKGRKREHKNA